MIIRRRRVIDSVLVWTLILAAAWLVTLRAVQLLPSMPMTATAGELAQATLNGTVVSRMDSMSGRIDHLERMADGTFLALVGLLISQIVGLRRRSENRGKY